MYQCGICKQWVSDGSVHSCSGYWGGTTPTQTTTGFWIDNAALGRIATALEAIAKALDKPKRTVKRRG